MFNALMPETAATRRTRSIVLALYLLLLMAEHAIGDKAADRWRVYEHCTLMTNHFADGDSFHVKAGRKEWIFRLYFVDAPEISTDFPERLSEQAAYFGVQTNTVLRIGSKARRFTLGCLSEPFTVYTRREDAKGQSSLPRYFAIIRTRNGFLCEALVRNGLARVYGKGTTLPDGTSARDYFRRLDDLEAEARRNRNGGWAYGARPTPRAARKLAPKD